MLVDLEGADGRHAQEEPDEEDERAQQAELDDDRVQVQEESEGEEEHAAWCQVLDSL